MLVFDSMSDVIAQGFCIAHVSSCCTGKRKTHKNYTWEYLPTKSKKEQLLNPALYPIKLIHISENLQLGTFKCKTCDMPFEASIEMVRQGFSLHCCTCKEALQQSLNKQYPRLVSILANMKTRCYNQNTEVFKNYGAAGIDICDEWYTSTENFILWALANSYQDDLTIDRIENSKGYNPSNCRWVTKEVQARNTRQLMSTNTSGYRGVSWNNAANKWQADIRVKGKTIYLGVYMTKEDAAKAYDTYILQHQLEHTRNNIEPSPEAELARILEER